MVETTTQTQVRLILERQCRELADTITAKAPAGTAFIIFLADMGEGGNVSYVSNAERDGAVKLIHQWLDRQDANRDVASLVMLLESAADLLDTIAEATGYEGRIEDPVGLVNHCKALRATAAGAAR